MFWLRLLGAGKMLLTWLRDLAVKYPWQVAFALALAWGVYEHRGWNAEIEARKHDAAAVDVARNEAVEKQKKQLADLKARYEQKAKDAQNDYENAIKAADTRLGSYAERMRLDKVCRGRPAASTPGSNPGVPPEVPAYSDMVAVSRTDLQDLVDWLAIGVEAHNEAARKMRDGRAIPDPTFGALSAPADGTE